MPAKPTAKAKAKNALQKAINKAKGGAAQKKKKGGDAMED